MNIVGMPQLHFKTFNSDLHSVNLLWSVCRYKVRVEIAHKQKESDKALTHLHQPVTSDYTSNSTASSDHHPSHVVDGVSGASSSAAEMEIQKWKRAYESINRENELLKTQSSDVLLLKKWQERYEECLREKEDILSKLKIFTRASESGQYHRNSVLSPTGGGGIGGIGSGVNAPILGVPGYVFGSGGNSPKLHSNNNSNSNNQNAPGIHNNATNNHSNNTAGVSVEKKSLEQMHIDLKDEYKVHESPVLLYLYLCWLSHCIVIQSYLHDVMFTIASHR